MTLFTAFNLTPGATVVNRGQTELKPVEATDVPEPATLLMFGSGLIGALFMRKRK